MLRLQLYVIHCLSASHTKGVESGIGSIEQLTSICWGVTEQVLFTCKLVSVTKLVFLRSLVRVCCRKSK